MIIADTFRMKLSSGDTDLISMDDVAEMTLALFENTYGKSFCHIQLQIRTGDIESTWNQVARTPDVMLKVQLASVPGSDSNDGWSRWKMFRLHRMFIKSQGDIAQVTLQGKDLISELELQSPQHVFKQMTISDMLSTIAEDHGFDTDIVTTTGEYTLRQGWANNYDFAVEELLPRARVKSPDDMFVFHVKSDKEGTPVMILKQLSEISEADPKLVFATALDEASEYDPFQRAYLNHFYSSIVINPTNFGSKGMLFDPLKTKGAPYLMSENRNDDTVNFPTFGTKKLSPFSDIPAELFGVVMEDLGLDFEVELKRRTPWKPFAIHRMAIPTLLLSQIEVGESAYVNAQMSNGQKLFSAGKYLIYGAYHSIDLTTSSTVTFLERRGAM